jgi:magnesium chelatase accessory protein
MTDPPDDWPNRGKGLRIRAGACDWWVVEDGAGPEVLLLHGAGGSGHSFAPLLPWLTPHYRCLVPDLPGQGFTRRQGQAFGLEAMAADLAALVAARGWRPAAIIGHSAGAAIALRLAEDMPLRGVIGINAALGTFEGLAGILFPALARGLALIPFLPAAISGLWGNPDRVGQLLASTGSRIGADGQRQYLTLVRSSAHVGGTLGMMSQWNLTPLIARLSALTTPVLLLTGHRDTTVPPRVSRSAVGRLPRGLWVDLPGLGHLMHEEVPAATAEAILPWLAEALAVAPPPHPSPTRGEGGA